MKKPLRTLHIVEDMRVGGLERVVASLVTRIDRERFDPMVWCLSGGGVVADQLLGQGIPVEIHRVTNYGDARQIYGLCEKMKARRIDIVQTHGFYAAIPGGIAAKIARVPIVINQFHTLFNPEVMSWRFRMMDAVLNRFFMHTGVAISESVRQSFIENEHLSPAAIRVIHNGIDGEKYQFTEPAGSQVVTVVASLTPHKNHETLLKAFKQIHKEFASARLWIVGDGPLRSHLEAMTRAMELDGLVIFKGLRDDVSATIAQSDIVALSSTREGLSLALLEAMAMGRPIVASRIGGIPEAVKHETNGFLADPQSAEEFTNYISLLLRNRHMARAMGVQGRRIFEEDFDVKIMVRKFEELYLELSQNARVRNVN